ncbi:glucosaminidase domain-containing protein [Sulfurimonas sp.]|uniref:glucosaminidase domain-containing protein n=1 Tax=Sulfurimonas sp. TaxID=2022749 RepID=UPI0026312E4D|nr:glucosaminidase domain-containing protein [Sulfurimonas sp.]
MEYLLAIALLIGASITETKLFKPTYTSDVIPKHMSTKQKKERFNYLLVPAVQYVHKELMQRYKKIVKDIKTGQNKQEIQKLKKEYGAKSDEDLLARLKPHPVSITLAQAAMESSWATSRFFQEANNVFGIWSTKATEPRIAASEQRGGKHTIWLRKFDTIEDSIRAYYELMSKGKAYSKFRKLRLETEDPYKITAGLDKYSEIGQEYINVLNQVIKHNNFTKYDTK